MDRKSDGNLESKKTNPGPENESAAAASGDNAAVDASKEVPEKEYVIDIFRDWCKGCGICAEFCPKKCIKMNEAGEPVVADAKRCTGCGWCELHCPDFAICVRELAASKLSKESED